MSLFSTFVLSNIDLSRKWITFSLSISNFMAEAIDNRWRYSLLFFRISIRLYFSFIKY